MTGDSAEFSPGKISLLFNCVLDFGPMNNDMVDYSVGLDHEGKILGLWQTADSDWCDHSHDVAVWVSVDTYHESELWARLLEVFLNERRIHDQWTGAELTSIKVPNGGPMTLTEIKAVIEKVWK